MIKRVFQDMSFSEFRDTVSEEQMQKIYEGLKAKAERPNRHSRRAADAGHAHDPLGRCCNPFRIHFASRQEYDEVMHGDGLAEKIFQMKALSEV